MKTRSKTSPTKRNDLAPGEAESILPLAWSLFSTGILVVPSVHYFAVE